MYALMVEWYEGGELTVTETHGPYTSELDLAADKRDMKDAAATLGFSTRNTYNGFNIGTPSGKILMAVYDAEWIEAEPEP